MVAKKKPLLKKKYQSRTVWLAVATAIAGAGPLVANFTGIVSPMSYAIALTVVGVANYYLRLQTDTGIE
jgi:hypothetical protein